MSPGRFFISIPSIDIAAGAASSLFEIASKGSTWEKRLLALAAFLIVAAFGILITTTVGYLPNFAIRISLGLGMIGVALLIGVGASFDYHRLEARSQFVTEIQERARAQPDEPQLAWDLARIKLESYLDRNLAQVSSIYYLTLIVMTFGMSLIGIGVWRAIMVPQALQAAGLAALAGVVVQIIGGTILLIYRSTMAQAKEYVIVLERINAVGMSINILEGIKEAANLRDEARVELSTTLLSMYSTKTGKSKVTAQSKRRSRKTKA